MTNENVRLLLTRMESYDLRAWTEERASDITALCCALLSAREDAERLAEEIRLLPFPTVRQLAALAAHEAMKEKT